MSPSSVTLAILPSSVTLAMPPLFAVSGPFSPNHMPAHDDIYLAMQEHCEKRQQGLVTRLQRSL
eukprot:8342182-Karenia_brevis.AAC.1